MADLVARYRDHMATFSDEFDRIRGLDAEPKARAMATLTHSIAGTAGSLGFKAVSDAAFSAEAATIRYLNGDAGWQDVEAQLQIVTVAVRDALDADDRAIA
jgi:HPt (histidine-containing phosphotransfer) domain-containing protein